MRPVAHETLNERSVRHYISDGSAEFYSCWTGSLGWLKWRDDAFFIDVDSLISSEVTNKLYAAAV